jgi:hypothetical protein
MRFIKKQFSWWRLVLIVGGTAIAIPVATGVSPTAIAVVTERPDHLYHQTTVHNEDSDAEHSKDSKAAVGTAVARPQDDYYERRREYWEKRVERRLDEEDLDDETGDDKDADSKDNKADKDDGDDEDDAVEQEVERRREYWRKRVERDW